MISLHLRETNQAFVTPHSSKIIKPPAFFNGVLGCEPAPASINGPDIDNLIALHTEDAIVETNGRITVRCQTLKPIAERKANPRLEIDPAVLVALKLICATCCRSTKDFRRGPVEREGLGSAVSCDKLSLIAAYYRGLYE